MVNACTCFQVQLWVKYADLNARMSTTTRKAQTKIHSRTKMQMNLLRRNSRLLASPEARMKKSKLADETLYVLKQMEN